MQVAMNPINTVFDAKRLIGRKYQDSTIQDDIKHWPFTVKSGPADKPLIEGTIIRHAPPVVICGCMNHLCQIRWCLHACLFYESIS